MSHDDEKEYHLRAIPLDLHRRWKVAALGEEMFMNEYALVAIEAAVERSQKKKTRHDKSTK